MLRRKDDIVEFESSDDDGEWCVVQLRAKPDLQVEVKTNSFPKSRALAKGIMRQLLGSELVKKKLKEAKDAGVRKGK